MTPQRIQLKRTKGWRKPAGVIVVSRPSKWGNPMTLNDIFAAEDGFDVPAPPIDREYLHHLAVDWHRVWMGMPESAPLREHLHELRGHHLACWCPLNFRCHADVLLELANP